MQRSAEKCREAQRSAEKCRVASFGENSRVRRPSVAKIATGATLCFVHELMPFDLSEYVCIKDLNTYDKYVYHLLISLYLPPFYTSLLERKQIQK